MGSCLINNSFFQTVPEAPNLWRLVDAKKQSPPKVLLISICDTLFYVRFFTYPWTSPVNPYSFYMDQTLLMCLYEMGTKRRNLKLMVS